MRVQGSHAAFGAPSVAWKWGDVAHLNVLDQMTHGTFLSGLEFCGSRFFFEACFSWAGKELLQKDVVVSKDSGAMLPRLGPRLLALRPGATFHVLRCSVSLKAEFCLLSEVSPCT